MHDHSIPEDTARPSPMFRWGGASLGVLAGLVPVLWIVDRWSWLQVLPAWSPVHFNFGLCLALMGLSLPLLGLNGRPGLNGSMPRWLATALLAPACAIGLLTLGQYLLGADAGIDQLLLDSPPAPGTSHPGRMAPLSALAVSLLTPVLLAATHARSAGGRTEWLAVAGLLAAAVALVQLTGYLFRQPGLTAQTMLTEMGMLAALWLLGLGALLLFEARSMTRTRVGRQSLLAWLIGMALLLCSFLVWLDSAGRDYNRLRTEARTASLGVWNRLDELMTRRQAHLQRQKLRLDLWGLPPDNPRWNAEIESYLDDFPELQAIGLIDSSGRMPFVLARQNPGAVQPGLFLMRDSIRRERVNRARRIDEVVYTPPVDLAIGADGVLALLRLEHRSESGVPWLLAHSMVLENIYRLAIRNLPDGYRATLVLDRETERDARMAGRFEALFEPTKVVSRFSPGWGIQVTPQPARIRSALDPIDLALFLIAAAMSTLATLLLRLYALNQQTIRDQRRLTRRLETAEELGRLGYWSLDLDSGKLDWSAQVFRLFGEPRRDLPPDYQTFLQRVPEPDRRRVHHAGEDSIRTGHATDVTHRISLPDGGVRWIRGRSRPVYDDSGRAIRMEGSVQDVTRSQIAQEDVRRFARQMEQVAALSQLLIDPERMQATLDSIGDRCRAILGARQAAIVLRQSGNGQVRLHSTSMSDEYAGAAGFSAPLEGRGLLAVLLELDEPMRLKQDEVEAHPNWEGFGKHAEHHPSLRGLLAAPLLDRDGHNAGLIMLSDRESGEFTRTDEQILVQIAGQLSAAIQNWALFEDVRDLNRSLEQRVRDRTRELDLANQELEAFAYSVSHDLRAPLRAIAGFGQILDQRHAEQLDDKGRHYLQRMLTSAGRLDLLISDLLELARVSRSTLKRETVDLSALAQRFAFQYRESGQSSHQHKPIDWQIEENIEVSADRNLAETLLTNLLDNAVKFSAAGPAPAIRIGREQHDGHEWTCIEDNGVGFDPDYADKLFELFQRLHTDKEFPGTGVGLATCKRIVLRHGGAIEGRSEPGRGARFCFHFGKAVTDGVDAPGSSGDTGRGQSG